MGQISLEQYNAIVNAIYEAPLSDDWESVVELLSSSMGCIHTHIFGYDTVRNKQLSLSGSMYDPAMLETYNAYYHEKNAWIPGVARAEIGKASYSEAYCSTEELKETEFFNDWIRPQEEIGGGGGIVLFNDGDRFIIIGGNIRFKDRDEKEKQWIDLLDLLAPHFQRSFRAYRALSEFRLTSRTYSEALDHVGYAVTLLKSDGRLFHQNVQADKLFRTGSLFYLDGFRIFRAFDTRASETILQTVAAIKAGSLSALPDVFVIREKDNEAAHVAMILPLSAAPESGSALLDFDRGELPVAMLIVKDPAKENKPPVQVLSSLYGLTPAESALAVAIADGVSLRTYADAGCVTIHTVRNQLMAIFGKTGTSRQAELVGLLARLDPRA